MARHRGFTLIELLLTLGIVAILISVATPRLLGARQTAVLESARAHSIEVHQAVSGWLSTHPTLGVNDFLSASGLPTGSLGAVPATGQTYLNTAPAVYDCSQQASLGVDGVVGSSPPSGYGWKRAPSNVLCVVGAAPDPSGIGTALTVVTWIDGQNSVFVNGESK